MENEKDLTIIETVPSISDDTLIAMADKAEKRIEAVNKIKKISLKVTNKYDWINQQGKPYLQVSGAEKIARLWGISWRIDEPLREDEEGGHFVYTYKGYFSMGSVTIEAIGTRSSKDGFFKRYDYSQKDENGHATKTELPASEIDKSDVKKAAYTNCIGNGITRLLGIRNLTWEELEAAGIKVDGVSKVEYKQVEEGKEAKDLRAEIRKMILEMAGNDSNRAKEILQEFTSFVPKGKSEEDRVRGKQRIEELTEKQIAPTYGKIKEAFEKSQKENVKTDAPASDLQSKAADFIAAMESMATVEACDALLTNTTKVGIQQGTEEYMKIKMARDNRVTKLRDLK